MLTAKWLCDIFSSVFALICLFFREIARHFQDIKIRLIVKTKCLSFAKIANFNHLQTY